jgi:hypothetical protein
LALGLAALVLAAGIIVHARPRRTGDAEQD